MLRNRSGVLCTALVAAALFASAANSPSETAVVAKRQFTRRMRATGTVQPVDAVTLRVPQLTEGGDIILTHVIANGAVVKPDDIVAEFDRTKQLDQARDAKAKFEDLRHQVEQKEAQRVLQVILGKMKEDRRSAFVLFEIEGLSGEEIARIQSVPLNTVWTRLHHARREFFALAARYQRVQRGKGAGRK